MYAACHHIFFEMAARLSHYGWPPSLFVRANRPSLCTEKSCNADHCPANTFDGATLRIVDKQRTLFVDDFRSCNRDTCSL